MGIPKFFKYIAERWPMILQLIDGQHIPEFDNLYLDMNSILHTCTHGNDDDVTKRLTEEEVFGKIFVYIDHLFHTIKPKKVFYMAIDGVAPRAKMNQQRARRFRTAMDAEKALQKAIEKGEEIPKGEPFDSNSITPGTEFMAKLTKNLQYFIHDKITNDSRWRDVQIIFSGHEVPGEGEHKIMDFIRNIRGQDDYNPNIRHCIYGLDADLIMLGLSVHDPHFALLREEVIFGRRSKSSTSLENQNFYLLHISLLREYLGLEFEEIADELQFEYDFERILDDFILIMFVIGNDFLPNLPDLHLNKGAFPLLMKTFKEALLHADGYINYNGKINLKTLKLWLHYLSQFELMIFEKDEIDVKWFHQRLENISIEGAQQRERAGKKLLAKQQKKIAGFVKSWVLEVTAQRYPADLPEEDIPSLKLTEEGMVENLDFLKQFAFDLGLIVTHSKSNDSYSLKLDIDAINPGETEEEHEDRQRSLRKTLKRYQQAILVEDQEELDKEKETYNERFIEWKDKYYKTKLGFSIHDTEKVRDITENYVEGLQWVLYYYYRGCASWGWYYHYHYAPRISDLEKGLDQVLEFEQGKPFTPFQQLMAVLPERSKTLIPAPFRPLMFDENSPIIDFYPGEVETDKNGKTADWEAVVLISFVDEHRLIEAMAPLLNKLTPEEKARNGAGRDLIYTYNPQVDEVYKSPLSGLFSDIEHNHCVEKEFIPPKVKEGQFRYGLLPNAYTGVNLLAGFPTLKSLPFTYELLNNDTRVFNAPSKNESMVLHMKNIYTENNLSLDVLAKRYMNRVVYTRWPYLMESKMVSISDGTTIYETPDKLSGKTPKCISRAADEGEKKIFRSLVANMKGDYKSSKAVDVGAISIIIKVLPGADLVRDSRGAYKKSFQNEPKYYPLQLMVETVANKDERYKEKEPLPIDQEFPKGSQVIFLGDYAYGGEAVVDGYSNSSRLKLTVQKMSLRSEPTIGKERAKVDSNLVKYYPSFIVAKKLQLHPLFLSRITSRFMVTDQQGKNINVGITVKFEGRHQKVLGYARRNYRGWEYSNLTVDLINEYRKNFAGFFNKLATIQGNRFPSVEELFPELSHDECRKLLQSVTTWIKTVTEKFVNVSLESDSLTKISMQAVEDYIEKYSTYLEQTEKKQLAKVPCEAVLDPRSSFALLRSQKFELGDRVIYIQDSGKVPLFSKGTVVGYTTLGMSLSIQVLFDKEIVAGNNFGGRLRTNRGLGLDASFLLNLTNRQFVYHSKASKQASHAKKNHSNAPVAQKQQLALDAKKKRAHDLLSHIKKADDTTEQHLKIHAEHNISYPTEEEKKAETQDQSAPKFVSLSNPSLDQDPASTLYNAVLNQYSSNGFVVPNVGVSGNSKPAILPYHGQAAYTTQPFMHMPPPQMGIPMAPPYGGLMQPPPMGQFPLPQPHNGIYQGIDAHQQHPGSWSNANPGNTSIPGNGKPNDTRARGMKNSDNRSNEENSRTDKVNSNKLISGKRPGGWNKEKTVHKGPQDSNRKFPRSRGKPKAKPKPPAGEVST
ncbi:ZYBA0S06-02674g1_1 [Zygosaccharomyces bailii CLIB 213]|uniref:5'-3' exoribonuclease 1 n=1 Tax=Zygosaccharomyces bailii (strain CLIB 213 / ATCC 58445 / CBS 680 / BCRC 21525 / NBRC 1098 / NCYC 1416 / NRRL Y-2227) TaxID=1333698 RepID=A0A8J2T7Z9_ZYGB2|nr:ZYBA0S06-02674g1_1 [Zygosaccharomyces bailii CLIB 213]